MVATPRSALPRHISVCREPGMTKAALASRVSCPAGRRQHCRTLLRVAALSHSNAFADDQSGDKSTGRLQRLPRISFSYDRSHVDAAELADLLSQVACFAPGQSFHRGPLPGSWDSAAAMAPWDMSSSSSGSRLEAWDPSSPTSSAAGAPAIDASRLHAALWRSLVCVAAFTEERHLPPQQHLAARGLLPPGQQGQQGRGQKPWAGGGGLMQQRRRARRVLVGFARAVGDGALVATVHDVAVLPELQGLGLGRQLVERLTRQLDMLGIIDIGLLAPDSSRGFFSACSFGRDTENSTVMALSPGGISSREGLPLEGMAVHIKQAQQQQQQPQQQGPLPALAAERRAS